ncbi:hypothetical protein C8R44DRAFT_808628 [Mycena epipterygia]|nr:hypothetical protein C8R44DRAFT_808628 [Mycena epipterygia]
MTHLVSFDRPSCLKAKRSFSSALVFRSKLAKNKVAALAPIIEVDEPEPGEEPLVFLDICNTPGRAHRPLGFASAPRRPLHIELRAFEKPYCLPSWNKQTTPTVEFMSLYLTEGLPVECDTIPLPSTRAPPSPRAKTDFALPTPPDMEDVVNGNQIPAMGPGWGFLGPAGSELPHVSESRRPGKRMREAEADEERPDAKRLRLCSVNDQDPCPLSSSSGRIMSEVPDVAAGRGAENMDSRPRVGLPRQPVLPAEKPPRRKRSFEQVEQSADEMLMDASRYAKTRVRGTPS